MRRCGLLAASLIAFAIPTCAGEGAALAAPQSTAAVSMGDSYISGEAGRWQGNSIDAAGSRDGTDRAWTGTGYDLSRVYLPPSDSDGCHRSDVAEIESASLAVDPAGEHRVLRCGDPEHLPLDERRRRSER